MGNNFGQELPKQTLDQIPQANSNAKRIIGLVKESGRSPGSASPTGEIRNTWKPSPMEVILNTNENGAKPFSLPIGQSVPMIRAFVISFLINHKCNSAVRRCSSDEKFTFHQRVV